VGVDFDMLYNKIANIGLSIYASIHWIQVVSDNHKLGAGGGHGVIENKVDTKVADSPYYDPARPGAPGYSANSREFTDHPWRTDGQNGHYWHAELYLVQEIAAKTAKFWAGVNWGWTNGADHAAQN
jgi:hypothetical protein